MISQAGILPDLLTKLLDSQNKSQANAWISKILKEVLNSETKKKDLKVNVEDSDWNEFIENYILTCDPSLKTNLDILNQLPNSKLTKEKVNKLKKLIEIYEDSEVLDQDLEIKTLEDLYQKDENSDSKWKLEQSIDWSTIPIGQCPDSSLSSQDPQDQDTCPEWLENDPVEVHELDWYYLLQNTN